MTSNIMVGEDSLDDLRQKGNHEFQNGDLDNAVMFYTLAIERALKEPLSPDISAAIVTNLCNRSACYFQMERYELAKDDAAQAWQSSNKTHIKAAYRLAKTLIELHECESAKATLQHALSTANPNTKEAKSLRDLLQEATTKSNNPNQLAQETTVKTAARPVSIREFLRKVTLGIGNFSEIIVAEHRVTKETFALKILQKKKAADLAKRQHPNVYNEIKMEARVLMERLPPHKHMVQMYHAFQDYENLYYLMDLHNMNPDLWSRIRYQKRMVGCHPSQIKVWLWQLIDALEHFHSHGIIHRDLKPENVLLNENNHIVVIDFGTAKDLVHTDLNGPEFVGTPDFMSPEAVTGTSGMPKLGAAQMPNSVGQQTTHCADLWALGAMAFILMTGSTPFWSPSPYLTFLKIKRGMLLRTPWGIPDDDAWNFIDSLVKVKPNDRIGADCYKAVKGKVTVSKGYDCLRSHKYFENFRPSSDNPIPSLRDLCVRACAELAKKDAFDLDVCDKHPPGDGSKHDMLRLQPVERKSILHVLDKCRVFSQGDETRVFQRFVKDDVDYLESKIRPESRDFVGLTQMNDDEGKLQAARGSADPYAKKDDPEPTRVAHLTNPLLLSKNNDMDDETKKVHLKAMKKCISTINRSRPKVVVVSGFIDSKCRKYLSRISDSIAVVLNDGSSFFSFWLNGFQGLVLQSSTLHDGSKQMAWIQEQVEQSRMAKHQVFAFVDCDPRELDQLALKRLSRGRTLLLSGLSKELPFEIEVKYEANEKVEDDMSVKSTDSEEDAGDEFSMKVTGALRNGIQWVTVDEMAGVWDNKLEEVL